MSIQTRRDPLPRPSRLVWLDASRVFAAIGVVLIHSTTDASGGPFTAYAPAQRAVPVMLRGVAEFSGAEIFIVFSMFLLAFKLSKQEPGYGSLIWDQAKKLFIPYLAWVVFFAVFRQVKASVFGYEGAILTELATWKAWAGYVFLGSAQYHLHFIPTLFGVLLAYPLFKSAVRFPAIGFALIVGLFVLNTGESWLWGHVKDPVLREYFVRILRICAYSGYGAFAFALFGVWKRGVSREDSQLFLRGSLLLLGLATVGTFTYLADLALTGHWGERSGAAFYGHFLTPALVFAVFMGAQYYAWSSRYAVLAKYTFGVYLVHPIFIDAFDILLHQAGWQPWPVVAIVGKFLVAVPLAFGLSYLLGKTRVLGWSIGVPATRSRAGAGVATAAKPAL